MTLADGMKMVMDLKVDRFLVMVGFDVKCTRQATYRVILPAGCQNLQVTVRKSSSNIIYVVSGIL